MTCSFLFSWWYMSSSWLKAIFVRFVRNCYFITALIDVRILALYFDVFVVRSWIFDDGRFLSRLTIARLVTNQKELPWIENGYYFDYLHETVRSCSYVAVFVLNYGRCSGIWGVLGVFSGLGHLGPCVRPSYESECEKYDLINKRSINCYTTEDM